MAMILLQQSEKELLTELIRDQQKVLLEVLHVRTELMHVVFVAFLSSFVIRGTSFYLLIFAQMK